MPCACNKNKNLFGVGPNEVIPLASATTTNPYTGTGKATSVYIVGFGTEYETVFTIHQRTTARTHARSVNPALTMVKAAAARLPHNVGVEVFGS